MKNKRVTEHCSTELLIGDHNKHEQKKAMCESESIGRNDKGEKG